ncbi:MAG: YraN family protein [Candidatus Pacebacteria bacterium]|nr:YraN family protein [Candidatus Paceibacterota bacterium]
MQNQSQKIGQIGEDIAADYLKKKGYQILNRNFKTKWGETDIVARKNGVITFVEVKTLQQIKGRPSEFCPEDEITFHKAEQLRKMAQIYLSANQLPLDVAQQIDILAIELTEKNQIANIRHTENAIEDY